VANPYSDPASIGLRDDLPNDENTWSAAQDYQSGVPDFSLEPLAQETCIDTAPWQTLLPLDAVNVAWPNFQWVDISQAGFAHEMCDDGLAHVPSEAYLNPSTPTIESGTGLSIRDNTTDVGNTVDSSDDNALHQPNIA
jgi:hypothetical protein